MQINRRRRERDMIVAKREFRHDDGVDRVSLPGGWEHRGLRTDARMGGLVVQPSREKQPGGGIGERQDRRAPASRQSETILDVSTGQIALAIHSTGSPVRGFALPLPFDFLTG